MNNIEDSFSYQSWLYDTLEPHEKLFVGRRPPRKPKAWMMKPPPRPTLTEKEIEEREDDYLRKYGL